jgi:2-oxo-4-hydroxy-4-carboxy-5-ureidoimidazoline decarboxylase
VIASDLATIFEHAPGLADRIGGRAVSHGAEAVISAAREELSRMTDAELVSVLDAHPRIGADPGSLSTLSRDEQGERGDAATLDELARLNDEYERKFGFRFVVFVKGRPKSAIAQVLRQRLARTRAEELATGVEEFLAIARDRLEKRA